MEFLTDYQRAIIKKFVAKTGKIIENGYAYAFAHPNAIKSLKCDVDRIREIEKIQRARPLPCNEKMLRDAYIRYISRVVKMGLTYIKTNRKFYVDFLELQQALNECSNQPQQRQQRPQTRRHAPNNQTYTVKPEDSTDLFFSSTFQQLEDLCSKVDGLRLRVDSMNKARNNDQNCSIKKSQDGMRKFNYELTKKLDELKQERRKRIQTILSSEESEAEVLLGYESFSQNLNQKRNPVKLGKIERNIVIPYDTNPSECPPKIKSKCFYRRDEFGGTTFDLQLDFEDGIMVNDKLANNIYIKSALPVRNVFGRRN